MMQFYKRNNGFTLLETLIAFSVFSAFMIAAHKSFVVAKVGAWHSDEMNRMAIELSSEINLAQFEIPSAPTETGPHFQRTRALPSSSSFDFAIDVTRLEVVSIKARSPSGASSRTIQVLIWR